MIYLSKTVTWSILENMGLHNKVAVEIHSYEYPPEPPPSAKKCISAI